MSHYSIYALDHESALELRKANRAAHLDYVRGSGKLEFGGPLADDEGNMIGSLVVIRAENRAEAEEFVANDPYNKAGLFKEVTIRRFIKP